MKIKKRWPTTRLIAVLAYGLILLLVTIVQHHASAEYVEEEFNANVPRMALVANSDHNSSHTIYPYQQSKPQTIPSIERAYSPKMLADNCAQLLLNPNLDVVNNSVEFWDVLDPKVYYTTQSFVSPQSSVVMPDADTGDPSPMVDAFGQYFVMPADLTGVTVQFHVMTQNPNATDKAFGNLWTVDDNDEQVDFIGGWEIAEANNWAERNVAIDDTTDLSQMAGQKMVIIFFTETNGEAPDEVVFLDDITLTACTDSGADPTSTSTVEASPTPSRTPAATATGQPASGQKQFLPAIFNPAAPVQPTPTPTPTTSPEPPGDWRLETVASEGDQGSWTSIALDTSGNPHVSFNDITRRRIVYAHRTGTGWQTQDIDQFAVWVDDLTAPSAVAVGPNNYPQITYKTNLPGVALRHAEWDGATWNVVQFSGVQPTWMAMALKQDGEPCISFYKPEAGPGAMNARIYFLCRSGGDWPTEPELAVFILGGIHDVGNSIHVLAIGNEDRPHLSYKDGSSLYYTRKTADPNTWLNSRVGSIGDSRASGWPSLALDSQDRAHISYYDVTNGDLKYARWDGSQWRVETVDSGGDVGKYTSIEVDGSDRAHISYYDVTNKNLKYARWDGSQWRIEIVDSAGEVGEFTSLALDAGGAAHISYYDRSNGDLKYATNSAARLRQPASGQKQFLPAVLNPAVSDQPTPTPTPTPTASPEPPDDWIVIASEDFEGEFPKPGWSLRGSNYTWAKRDCRPASGSFSGWAVGGGPVGSDLSCGADYPGYLMGGSAPPILSYGPFSLVGASDAQFQFKVWTNIASASGDSLAYCASRNNFNFYCSSMKGSSNGWETRTFSLKYVSGLGSLLGEPKVWIRFVFSSYEAPYLPEGAYLDDIVLHKKE